MNSLTVILGGISLVALGACNVTASGGVGSTGAGGTTTATTTTTSGGVGGSGGSGGSATTTTTTTTTTGGAGGCDPMYTCAEAITAPDGDPTKLCNGQHGDAYDAYQKCVCTAAGACAAKCGDNRCAGKADTADCTTCIQAAAPDGCKTQNEACANDAP